MAVLLLADLTGTSLGLDATAKAVSAVGSLGDIVILCVGADTEAAAREAAAISGVSKVLYADDEVFRHRLAEPTAALVASLGKDFSHIVAPATNDANNVLPRVAALLDVMVISSVTAVIDAATFERPIYAGNAVQTVRSVDGVKVFSVRTAGQQAAAPGGSAPVERISASSYPALSTWIEDKFAVSDRPQLTSAKIVVSGGRGVGSQESFALIETLADRLGAAVGASRAAVDAGYAPNDWQVGQTGKVVAPNLYIAVGISGAIQHLAGMKDSKVIVAINKDRDAPIFQIADYGVVEDLFTAVPALSEKVA